MLSPSFPFRKACDLPPRGDRFNLHHRALSLPRLSVGSSGSASAASFRAGLNLADHQVLLPSAPSRQLAARFPAQSKTLSPSPFTSQYPSGLGSALPAPHGHFRPAGARSKGENDLALRAEGMVERSQESLMTGNDSWATPCL